MIPYTDVAIWYPRYHDKAEIGSWTVMVAVYKVKQASKVRIYFTKAKHLEGVKLYMTGNRLRQYPIDTNGTIDCYAVPYNDFNTEPLEKQPDDICILHNHIKTKHGECPQCIGVSND